MTTKLKYMYTYIYLTARWEYGLVAGTLEGRGSLRRVATCRSLKATEKQYCYKDRVQCAILRTYMYPECGN